MASVIKNKYFTLPNEFAKVKHVSFSNLSIRPDIGFQERIVALIKECRYAFSLENITSVGTTHGGYIPIQIAPVFKQVILEKTDVCHSANILANIQEYGVSNILLEEDESAKPLNSRDMVYLNGIVKQFFFVDGDKPSVVLSIHSDNHTLLSSHYKNSYTVSHTSC